MIGKSYLPIAVFGNRKKNGRDMENTLNLNLNTPTDISHLDGRVISFFRLQLKGTGRMSGCVLRFFNNHDKPHEAATVKLVRPEFTNNQVLIPQSIGLLLMDYQYCQITDVTGFIYEGDDITLTLTEPKLANLN